MRIRVVGKEITRKEVPIDSVLPDLDIKHGTWEQAYKTQTFKRVILKISHIPKYHDHDYFISYQKNWSFYEPRPDNKYKDAYNTWMWQPIKTSQDDFIDGGLVKGVMNCACFLFFLQFSEVHFIMLSRF